MKNRTPLLIASALALAALGIALIFWPAGEHRQAVDPLHERSSAPTEPTSPAAEGEHQHHERSAPDIQAQRVVVEKFAAALADPSASQNPQAWLARLEPLVSEDLLEGYRYTDPRLLPQQKPVELGPLDELVDVFVLEYADGDRTQVILTRSAGGDWQVDQVERDD